jgi:hypothetical protein
VAPAHQQAGAKLLQLQQLPLQAARLHLPSVPLQRPLRFQHLLLVQAPAEELLPVGAILWLRQ